MSTAAWLTVLLTAVCLHESHAFVSPRPFLKTKTRDFAGPMWEATNKFTPKNEKPNGSSAFVMPAASKNSTVTISNKDTRVEGSNAAKDKVANVTNAAFSRPDAASVVPPAKAPDNTEPKMNLMPLDKAYNAPKRDTLLNEKSESAVSSSAVKDVEDIKSTANQAGIDVLAPNIPVAASQTFSIYDRKEVPPLEQIPSREKAAATTTGASDSFQSKADESISKDSAETKAKSEFVAGSSSVETKEAMTETITPMKAETSSVASKKVDASSTAPKTDVKEMALSDPVQPKATLSGQKASEETKPKATFIAAPGGVVEENTEDPSKQSQEEAPSAMAKDDPTTPSVERKAVPETTKPIKSTFIAGPSGEVEDGRKTIGEALSDAGKDEVKSITSPKAEKSAMLSSDDSAEVKTDGTVSTASDRNTAVPSSEVKDKVVETPKPFTGKAPNAIEAKDAEVPSSSQKTEAPSVVDTKGAVALKTEITAKAEDTLKPGAQPAAAKDSAKNAAKPLKVEAIPVIEAKSTVSSASPKIDLKDTSAATVKTKETISSVVSETEDATAPLGATSPDVETLVTASITKLDGEAENKVADALKAEDSTTAAKKVEAPTVSIKIETNDTSRAAPKSLREKAPSFETKANVPSTSPKDEVKDKSKATTKSLKEDIPAPAVFTRKTVSNTAKVVPPSAADDKDALSSTTAKDDTAAAVPKADIRETSSVIPKEWVEAPKPERKDTAKDVSAGSLTSKDAAQFAATKDTAPTKQGKSGIGSLADLFFGSKVAPEQGDDAVMRRIKERKQAKGDEKYVPTVKSRSARMHTVVYCTHTCRYFLSIYHVSETRKSLFRRSCK